MKKTVLIFGLVMVLFACKESTNQIEEVEEIVEEKIEEVYELVLEKDGIKLTSNQLETQFEDANIELLPVENQEMEVGMNSFRFAIENYELGSLTNDVLSGQCANSSKGQHIHFIVNNAPYKAHYEAEFEGELNEGHNVMLAFLSRSYHMSLKNSKAFVLKEYSIGEAEDNFDETQPHLFYSRPKGTYVGADVDKVMLDFYLINTDLKDKSYSVEATINGVVFELDVWRPFFIEGLVEGENTIKLRLLDAEGNLVPGPFNEVERTITLNFESENE